MVKRILSLLLACCLTLALLPPTASAAERDFVIENGILIKYEGPGGDVVIPYGVTRIGDAAFANCNSVTSVTITYGVTSIGPAAFNECSSLVSVTIPDSVTSIERGAFWNCCSLKSMKIPDSVTSVGEALLWGCSSLTEVVLPNGLTSIERYTFWQCISLKNIKIPNSVTTIGTSAFGGCSSLTGVIIPDGTANIEMCAFSECSSLKYVSIPDSVKSIESNAFSYCRSLMSVSIPRNITQISIFTFVGCDSLTSVTIPDSVTNIDSCAFGNALKDVYYTGSKEQWRTIAISLDGNYRLLNNATIHYNSRPVEAFGSVMLLNKWDADSGTLSFADTPISYHLADGSKVRPDQMAGRYVLIQTDTDHIFNVTNLQVVDSQIGIVSAALGKTLTIDGVEYPVARDLILSFYIGKNVLYHVKDGEIVGLSVLEEKSGIIDKWNSGTQEITIDWRAYPTNFLTDISFLANIDQNLNKQATFLVASGSSYTPILKITGYTEPAPGSIREGFCFTANTPMNSLPLGSTIDLYVGYYVNNRLDSSVKDYITVVGNREIVSIESKNWNSNYGQHYKVTAKRVGQTTLAVSHPYFDDASPVDIFVVPTDTAYCFNSVPKMTVEEGKVTNFYNYEGLV